MHKVVQILSLLLLIGALVPSLEAKEIKTNEAIIKDAPEWLTESRVDRVTFRIQQKLEWTTRRVEMRFYENPAAFARAHALGPNAIAVTVGKGNQATVHFGPLVNEKNFDATFGHELVHVIIIQKYRGAIPKWLEEGLANHYSNHGKVDYKLMATQKFPDDVQQLAHPLLGSQAGVSYRYQASQALAEMLDKKCGLENLVRLSVQRKMEDYIKSYCEIADLNTAFRNWVKAQAAAR